MTTTNKLYGLFKSEPTSLSTPQLPQSNLWTRFSQRVKSPPVVLLAVVAFLVILSVYPSRYLQHILGFVEQLGSFWGTIVLVLLFVSTAVLFLPGVGATLAIFSGYWGGIYLGTCLSWLGGATGAVVCFALGRAVLHARVAKWSESYPLFTAIANSVTRSGGWKLIVLLRVSPLTPFTLISYLLSATNITPQVYTISTIAGMLPPTAFFCYIGTAARSVTDVLARSSDDSDPTRTWVMYISLILTIVAAVVITIMTSRAIQRELRILKREGEMSMDLEGGRMNYGASSSNDLVMRNTPVIGSSAMLPRQYSPNSTNHSTMTAADAESAVQLV